MGGDYGVDSRRHHEHQGSIALAPENDVREIPLARGGFPLQRGGLSSSLPDRQTTSGAILSTSPTRLLTLPAQLAASSRRSSEALRSWTSAESAEDSCASRCPTVSSIPVSSWSMVEVRARRAATKASLCSCASGSTPLTTSWL